MSAIEQAPGSRMIPQATLRQMAALLEKCEKVVTNDDNGYAFGGGGRDPDCDGLWPNRSGILESGRSASPSSRSHRFELSGVWFE